MILRREDVARGPADLGAQRGERLDEHGRLDGHVQRTGDASTLERQHLCVLATEGHQSRHLVLGEPDLLAAELGERKVRHLEIDPVTALGHGRG